MASAMGGVDKFNEQVGKFKMSYGGAQSGNWADSLHSHIKFNPRLFREQGESFAKGVIVHEMAHIWDQQQGGAISDGLVQATGGNYYREGWWIGDFPVNDEIDFWFIHVPKAREIYQYGTTPISAEAMSSRGEDWAYSVQTWIYGIYADRSDLTVDRQDYMRQLFPGTSY